ncbi:hypothetical protein [Campylobacter troglodytis]|uniref:hypothetical protein n=1 Tax=Campylobacter troglodytis TaxID=654363 RepID=UPI00115AF8D5|nr:hypothetical protein [Campylobacter troglodytis]TQR54627.1 hypothetical protein DMC01_10100 [Campylobacter troglodytis]
MPQFQESFKAYCALVDLCAKAHYRVKHAKFEFAKGHKHINEIVIFFCFVLLQLRSRSDFAKFKLAKFKD